jgi:hypothetical protein
MVWRISTAQWTICTTETWSQGQLAQTIGTMLDHVDLVAIQALASREPSDQRRLATTVQTVDAPAVDVAPVEFIQSRGDTTAQDAACARQLTSRWAAFRREWLGVRD